ncbi:unnamed protein product [Penicillium camemberti]|uniref:Str. FM013 n=1 Tax=Penicillium camemberti (strain FM 013) TaxID=1429867 RepID=A0A0G4PUM0_PENC3|nr:unnamed protein product [Penicillium camemberti]
MAPQDYELQKDSPTPNIALIKEFIWWYTISTKGRLRPDGRPAVITTLTCAERFFRGFATATGNMVAEEDRLEIYRSKDKLAPNRHCIVDLRWERMVEGAGFDERIGITRLTTLKMTLDYGAPVTFVPGILLS